MLQLTFNPGLTLTDVRTTRPWCLRPVTSQLRHSLVVHPLLKKSWTRPCSNRLLLLHSERSTSNCRNYKKPFETHVSPFQQLRCGVPIFAFETVLLNSNFASFPRQNCIFKPSFLPGIFVNQ